MAAIGFKQTGNRVGTDFPQSVHEEGRPSFCKFVQKAISSLAFKVSTYLTRNNLYREKIQQAFQKDFLRRIVGKERADLCRKLERIQNRPLPQDALNAFVRGEWAHKIFQERDWPLLALRAFIDGQLDEMQISKLNLFDYCREFKDFQIHSLINPDNSFNRDQFELLKRGFPLERFEDKIKLLNLNRDNAQFFSFRFPLLTDEEYEKAYQNRIIDLYNEKAVRFPNSNYFMIVDKEKNEIQVLVLIPSFLHELLKLTCGKNATRPNPILGFDPNEKMYDFQSRVLAVPFRYVSLPETVHDGIVTAWAGMYMHDIDHLLADSMNPHRKMWVELATNLNLSKKSNAILDDRDISSYSQLDRMQTLLGRKFRNSVEIFWYSFPFLKVFANEEDMRSILTYILGQKDWDDYGISLASLEACCRNEPDTCKLSLKPWLDMARQIASENNGYASREAFEFKEKTSSSF